MNIYAFAMIRNGVKFDYPFRESLLSMKPFVKRVYIAVGKSGEGTEEAVAAVDMPLKIIPTIWDDQRTDRGHIFSEQTNIALENLRGDLKDTPEYASAWAIYLQCDEVFHEHDNDQIVKDIEEAEKTGCDALRFRYLHFWQNHNEIAINKKWYPQEIRAIKLKSNLINTGDAQSFGGFTKVFESDVPIYHYGHVREQKAYAEKMERMIRYYHPTEGLGRYIRKWNNKDKKTETLPFYGDHPEVMRERIKRLGGVFAVAKEDQAETLYIKGKKEEFAESFLQRIGAHKVYFIQNVKREVPIKDKKFVIYWQRNLIERLFYPSLVPPAMRSKLARPWTNEFRLILKLSEKGFGLKKL